LRIAALGLEDFRNFERAEVELVAGLNLVVGRNAQGKTNLLESIYCLGGLGSPRGQDAVLVRNGCERALLHALVDRSGRTVRVDIEVRPGRGTRALINRTPVASPAPLGEISTSVFFGPDELSLIKGSPEGRRRFLDDLVVKLRPGRHGLRRQWERVLRQRNALLRSAPRPGPSGSTQVAGTLAVWDESLCRIGATVAAARLEALARLLPFARKRYAEVAGGGEMELRYASSWLDGATPDGVPDEARLREALAERLEEARARELERGVSLVGPHRDDVGIRLRSSTSAAPVLDARTYASQGDQRTAALALKLAESDLLADALGEHPILLLDDVFSELDPSRRAWLSDAVRGHGQQVVLSSAEPDAANAARADLLVEVTGGRIEARGGVGRTAEGDRDGLGRTAGNEGGAVRG
jgi:DNA replication and repair protein RecF